MPCCPGELVLPESTAIGVEDDDPVEVDAPEGLLPSGDPLDEAPAAVVDPMPVVVEMSVPPVGVPGVDVFEAEPVEGVDADPGEVGVVAGPVVAVKPVALLPCPAPRAIPRAGGEAAPPRCAGETTSWAMVGTAT